ncbi:MAG: ATP-binding protein, partial [Lachnospiraceae bacterium]|nr:ATP-binding protein [Lachnospiraceae bacterium]
KTPISAMRLLLQREEQKQTEDETVGMEKSVLYDMQQELFWINQYINMALQYQRMNSGMNDLVLEMVSADRVVRTAIRRFAPIMIRKKIAIHYEECREMVLSDEKWLEFVIEQILSNAIKYTAGGPISIYLKEEPEKETKELIIEDTGIGIAPEDLPRIFEKGYTGYNGHADKRSTGIGLYLCRKIMRKLSHEITIESEIGKGTRVHLRLQ